MLCLFDIDGTLIDTRGAGMTSLKAACRDVFGDEGPPLDLGGATDLGLLDSLCAHFGQDAADTALRDRFFASYHGHLDRGLGDAGYTGQVIEGAEVLVEALAATTGTVLGLLTGNTARGAAIKMRRHGLDRHFPFGAYGCDHADRNCLGPIALARAARHSGRTIDAGRTWIIGDTPRDIACARAIGARCIAVATGGFSRDQLARHRPDHVCDTLAGALPLFA